MGKGENEAHAKIPVSDFGIRDAVVICSDPGRRFRTGRKENGYNYSGN